MSCYKAIEVTWSYVTWKPGGHIVYYVHLACVRFEHSVCHGWHITTYIIYIYVLIYIYIYYIYIIYIYIYIYNFGVSLRFVLHKESEKYFDWKIECNGKKSMLLNDKFIFSWKARAFLWNYLKVKKLKQMEWLRLSPSLFYLKLMRHNIQEMT